MQIDWFTVGAQLLNFLVLVWLLKRFLYGPIVDAMKKREQGIHERLDSAQQRERHAEEKAERFESESAALAQKKDELLIEARREADTIRRDLKDAARAEVADLRDIWLREWHTEQLEIRIRLRQQVVQHVSQSTQRILMDLADAELEAQTVRVFVQRLASLNLEEKNQIRADLQASSIRIRSAFVLPENLRDDITHAVSDLWQEKIEPKFEHELSLVCGLELVGANHRLSWNIAETLDNLEAVLSVTLEPSAGESA